MDNRVCCPTTFALNRWLHNLSNGAFVTCKYRTFQSGMAGSFQWNLLHDSFGTEDSVQQAPHLEGEVKETIALSLGLRGSHWLWHCLINFVLPQDAKAAGRHRLHFGNTSSVSARSRLDSKDQQRRITDIVRGRSFPHVLDNYNEIFKPGIERRSYETNVDVSNCKTAEDSWMDRDSQTWRCARSLYATDRDFKNGCKYTFAMVASRVLGTRS